MGGSTTQVWKWIKSKDGKYLYASHNNTIRADLNGNVYGGGGSTQVQQPTPPAAPTTTSSIADWVQNYPAVYALQEKYAPLEAARQVSLAQAYAQPYGQAFQRAQEAMYPEATALTKGLTAQAQEGMQGNVPSWMQEQYRSDVNANLGTNAGSPVGADYMSRGLLAQREQYKNYYQNMALSIAGRQPIAQAQAPVTPNYTQGFTPNAVMGSNIQAYSPYASAYSSMYGANAGLQGQMYASQMGLYGQLGSPAIKATGDIIGSSRRYKKNVQRWG